MKLAVTRSTRQEKRAVSDVGKTRSGRPPNADAGEVDERILDAARTVFLDRGYEGASFEQIAAIGHVGKATIYARYANKEALFSAVIRCSVERSLASGDDVPHSMPLASRLQCMAQSILERLLAPEVIALMRVIIAEGSRFPSLARLADEFARRRSIEIVSHIFAEDGRHEPPATRRPPGQSSEAAARLFLDLTVAPFIMRALMGGDLAALRDGIPAHVAEAIDVLRALKKI